MHTNTKAVLRLDNNIKAIHLRTLNDLNEHSVIIYSYHIWHTYVLFDAFIFVHRTHFFFFEE